MSLPVFAVLLTVRACRDGASTQQPRGWAGASWCSAGPEADSTTVEIPLHKATEIINTE